MGRGGTHAVEVPLGHLLPGQGPAPPGLQHLLWVQGVGGDPGWASLEDPGRMGAVAFIRYTCQTPYLTFCGGLTAGMGGGPAASISWWGEPPGAYREQAPATQQWGWARLAHWAGSSRDTCDENQTRTTK